MYCLNYSTWSWSLAIVSLLCIVLTCSGEAMTYVPAIFAFGDSIVDAGNNNNLPTVVKCNFPPNGKDFEGHKATGRFCNGRLPTDFIIEKFGIKANLPAYLDDGLKEKDLLTGVSFASAGSGYDYMSAEIAFSKTLDEQLKWFKEYRRKIKAIVGAQRTSFILNNSVFFIVTGSCDLANTYFTFPFRRLFYDVDSYTDLMLNQSTSFIQKLYEAGARTIAVSNVPPLGYLPMMRTLAGGVTREVLENYNQATELFNDKLKTNLPDLNSKLINSTLIYLDTYSIFLDLVLNSTHYGFEVTDRGCCGSGLVEAAVLCNPFSVVCDKKFLFWDSYHPSEKAYELIATQLVQQHFPHLS